MNRAFDNLNLRQLLLDWSHLRAVEYVGGRCWSLVHGLEENPEQEIVHRDDLQSMRRGRRLYMEDEKKHPLQKRHCTKKKKS